MFFIASKLFEFFAAPSRILLFALAVGAVLTLTRHARLGRRFIVASVTLLLLLAFGPLAHFLAAPLEARFPAPGSDLEPPDGVIVLGGSVNEALSAKLGRPTFAEAAERLTAPIELLRRFPKTRVVFTGGSGRLHDTSGETEARWTQAFWRAIGLDKDDGQFLYEDRSRNTRENAVFTRDLVRPKPGERWLLVTSAMHIPRSVGIFRQIGFPVIAYPVDYRTDRELLRLSLAGSAGMAIATGDAAAHEWIGLVVYRMTGWTDALFPAP